MISLAKTQIENVTLELVVEETIGSRLGGYPTLLIGDVCIESIMVQEVDTLQFIKALHTSESIKELSQNLQNVWNYDKFIVTIKSFAFNMMSNRGLIVESVHNDQIIKEIETIVAVMDESDDISPMTRTLAESRLYDLHQKLDVI